MIACCALGRLILIGWRIIKLERAGGCVMSCERDEL